jgi:hypothetical protein
MPRMSLELVVIMIVILIVALVVVGVFTGGIQNFMNILNPTTDRQVMINLCMSAYSQYCFLHPDKETVTSDELDKSGLNPTYKGKKIKCGEYIGSYNCKQGKSQEQQSQEQQSQEQKKNQKS